PREAARLLAPSEGVHGLAALAGVFGCDGRPLPLDAASRQVIGAPARSRLSVATGPDERRLLLAALPAGTDLRQAVLAVANGVVRTSPHLHWAIVARARGGGDLILAACSPRHGGARVSALTVHCERVTDSDIETVRLLSDASLASG